MNSHTARYVEVAILSALFVLGGELLLQRAPGIETFSVTVAGTMRLLLFTLGCVAAGYWLRTRIAGESAAVVAIGAAFGVAFGFGDRFYRGDVELPQDVGGLGFDAWHGSGQLACLRHRLGIERATVQPWGCESGARRRVAALLRGVKLGG